MKCQNSVLHCFLPMAGAEMGMVILLVIFCLGSSSSIESFFKEKVTYVSKTTFNSISKYACAIPVIRQTGICGCEQHSDNHRSTLSDHSLSMTGYNRALPQGIQFRVWILVNKGSQILRLHVK